MSIYRPWQLLVTCAAAFAVCLLLRSGQMNILRQRHDRVYTGIVEAISLSRKRFLLYYNRPGKSGSIQ